MKANYYIGLTIPDAESGSLSIHANWFDVDPGQIPLSHDMISGVLMQNQKHESESHDNMINSNDVPGECDHETP